MYRTRVGRVSFRDGFCYRMIERLFYRLDPVYRLRTRSAKRWLPDVLASLEIDKLLEIRTGAREKIDNLHYLKYFNVEGYIWEHLQRVVFLGLHNGYKDVLDIGTGFGYFSYICMFFNNRVKATDLPGIQLFDEVTNFLGVDKVHHRIEPFQPLPDFGVKFDIINAARVAFLMKSNLIDRWGPEEWDFFLEDVVANQLRPGGRLFLDLNYHPRHKGFLSSGVDPVIQKHNGQRRWGRIMVHKPAATSVKETSPATAFE